MFLLQTLVLLKSLIFIQSEPPHLHAGCINSGRGRRTNYPWHGILLNRGSYLRPWLIFVNLPPCGPLFQSSCTGISTIIPIEPTLPVGALPVCEGSMCKSKYWRIRLCMQYMCYTFRMVLSFSLAAHICIILLS